MPASKRPESDEHLRSKIILSAFVPLTEYACLNFVRGQRLIIITLVTAAMLAPLVIITAFFAVEVFAGLVPLRSCLPGSTPASAVLIIPAHNEELVIGDAVAALRKSCRGSRILVVADNCADGTAELARTAGAHVVVRDEPDRRGKGYALAAARDQLRGDPPDVVVVLDADCRIDQSSLSALIKSGADSGRACQAVYLFSSELGVPPLVQISNFAFMIKNLVRQRGLERLAGRVHLTGSGMAFPWSTFAEANLGGANLVEDFALGIELAAGPAAPMLVEAARVWSSAASTSGTLSQRSRWEGGFLRTAWSAAPSALVTALRRMDLRLLFAALDLFIPPVALLVLLNAVGSVVAVAMILAAGEVWPAVVQIIAGLLALIALFAAWIREGRRFVSLFTLVRLPFYVLWKLPLYVNLFRRGAPKEWIRTER